MSDSHRIPRLDRPNRVGSNWHSPFVSTLFLVEMRWGFSSERPDGCGYTVWFTMVKCNAIGKREVGGWERQGGREKKAERQEPSPRLGLTADKYSNWRLESRSNRSCMYRRDRIGGWIWDRSLWRNRFVAFRMLIRCLAVVCLMGH